MNGIKISSRKAKGRNLQKMVRKILLEHFEKKLEEDDIRSTGMGQSGVDLLLSPLAQKLFPYSVECKNCESLNIFKALEQAEHNSTDKLKPIVIFKRNRSKTFVTLEFDEFLRLLKNQKNNEEENTIPI
jgi:hypothetical protein